MASLLVSKRKYEGVYAYLQLDMSPDKNCFIHRYDLSIRELVDFSSIFWNQVYESLRSWRAELYYLEMI